MTPIKQIKICPRSRRLDHDCRYDLSNGVLGIIVVEVMYSDVSRALHHTVLYMNISIPAKHNVYSFDNVDLYEGGSRFRWFKDKVNL